MLRLEGRLHGFQEALAMLEHGADGARPSSRKSVRPIILKVFDQANGSGLSVQELMDAARRQGHRLNSTTVSSQLSRLKGEGKLRHTNGRYYSTTHDGLDGSVPREEFTEAEGRAAVVESDSADKPTAEASVT